ncbi:MAG TPA: LptF/LptG family permease [Candidatus Acidoferrales bacterium]|nr:LptF/LptG family permease [Candidatus Acidoferrales bacterium]
MRILDRYILREMVSYAGLSLGVFLFILMIPEVLRMSELLAQGDVPLPMVVRLLWSVVPGKLMWVIPVSTLASLLVALSRAAADREVIAMEATGISPLRLLRPTVVFGVVGGLLTLLATAWWGPWGARSLRALQAELAAGRASYEVRAGVFDERFPNSVLYVQDIESTTGRWRGVLLANIADRENPRLTVAESAVAVPEPGLNRLLIHLYNGSTHSQQPDQPQRYSVSTFAESVVAVALPAAPSGDDARRNADLGLGALWEASQQGPQWRIARADFHRRLALPVACLIFGLVALPLGLLAQRSGRPVGFVTAVAAAIFYYMVFITGDRLAREGKLLPVLGVWLANLALLLPALVYLPGRRSSAWGVGLGSMEGWGEWLRGWLPSLKLAPLETTPTSATARRAAGWRLVRTLDLYVVRGAFFYAAVLLIGLTVLFSLLMVLEMVDEIAAHHISWGVVARFLWYLQPQAIYWMAPLAFLLGLLLQVSLLAKHNELVAMRSAGISLYRVAAPVVVLGLAVSVGLFALDYYHLPYANQRQEVLRNQIKGRPPQTFLPTTQRWVFGEQRRVYYYAFFDPTTNLLGRVNVLEFPPDEFTLRRRISAHAAHWEQQIPGWVFERGWERVFNPDQTITYQPFQATTFAELREPPAYFRKEVRESALMNFQELGTYIAVLRQGGFDVSRLEVQWYKKFSYPLVAAIIVLLAYPFAVAGGRRGAIGGLAVGIGLGLSYWALMGFFEALGNFGLLPPMLAAWGPALAFFLGGVYLTLQVET